MTPWHRVLNVAGDEASGYLFVYSNCLSIFKYHRQDSGWPSASTLCNTSTT